MAVRGELRHDNDATAARRGPAKAFAFPVASFLRKQSGMGVSRKFWVVLLMLLLPGGLILAPVVWFVQRWWRQRSLTTHPTLHPHPSLHA